MLHTMQYAIHIISQNYSGCVAAVLNVTNIENSCTRKKWTAFNKCHCLCKHKRKKSLV